MIGARSSNDSSVNTCDVGEAAFQGAVRRRLYLAKLRKSEFVSGSTIYG